MSVQVPERVELAQLPTPLVRLERLSAQHGGAQIWIKRDDLTGLELSGNKVRKLEYVVGEARAQGCDALVTEGAWQSNHCRATAAVGTRLGMSTHLLLRELPDTQVQGNYLLDRLLGANIESFPPAEYAAQRDRIIADRLEALRRRGARPRWVPVGASEPTGCWGYVRGIGELAVQMRAAGMAGCDLVVAHSSGGTLAGLLLGKLLHRLEQIEVWGVLVSDDPAYRHEGVARLCDETIRQFELPIRLDPGAVRLIDGYVGPAYAAPSAPGLAALRELARREAILLDPVYTSKAFAALLDGVREGRFGRERPVVFLHTGGIFSNFAWAETLCQA